MRGHWRGTGDAETESMNYPKNTKAVMRDLADVIEEALLPIGYNDRHEIDEGDAIRALRRYRDWQNKVVGIKPKVKAKFTPPPPECGKEVGLGGFCHLETGHVGPCKPSQFPKCRRELEAAFNINPRAQEVISKGDFAVDELTANPIEAEVLNSVLRHAECVDYDLEDAQKFARSNPFKAIPKKLLKRGT